MSSRVTRKHAVKIAKKLKAEIKSSTRHDLAFVKDGNKIITTFQIRRGPRTDHGLIHENLFISQTQAVSMAQCNISREEWLDMIREQGKL